MAGVWRVLVIAIWAVREIVRTAWSIARGPIVFVLQVLAALIVLFEEWGWKPLSEALHWLAKFAPVAALERWIASLRPYPSLFVFALPTTVLLPLKFVAMWLLAAGQYWAATGLFIAAKIASTALVARIFTLTKPALMQIGWFAKSYNWFVPWKDAFFTTIRASWPWRYGRMVKNAIRLEVKQAWVRWRPSVLAALAPWKARGQAIATRVKALFLGRAGP
ncbi:MAG: hypothetical protein ABL893_13590 [Hyphomicrobium sp.]